MQFTASPKIYENMLIARSLQSTLVSLCYKIRIELSSWIVQIDKQFEITIFNYP